MELVKTEQAETAAYDLPGLTSYFFYAARQGMILADAQCRIIAANVAAQRLTGYREAELLGRTPELFDGVRCGAQVVHHIRCIVQRAGHWEGELWCCRKDGTRYPQQTSVTPLPGGGYAAVFDDSTAHRQQVETLTRLAFYDPLTGLPNRALLMDRLGQALVRAGRRHRKAALLFVDLDGFKAVNDGHGHALGDTLLQAAADRLRAVVRAEDTVARYGGDEFAVLLGEIGSADDAVDIAAKVSAVFSGPFLIDGREHVVSLSVGVALFPDHAAGVAEMIEIADAAMYRAKRAGKSGYQIAR
ncbi:MAG: hypothetical protein CVV05_08820 [Gammaproteobacteria bacterium HGW-Gammaproteobacteria-1]|jgi:diguanylate cyclase (GGDEF)-like protein/PAS domain S-box-containing protein|nr:MAG: hypothetical protein CVV05_08820 [Gammaproteobacteria bacterium HGW-Gammaproteobacteria-1]